MKHCLFLFLILTSFFSFGQESNSHFYPFKDSEGWGVKRADGKEVFPARYDSVLVFNYGVYKNRIRVRKDNKWGIVDSFGMVLIPFGNASLVLDLFGYETVLVHGQSNSKRGFINLKGDTIVPLTHSFISSSAIGNRGDFLVLALLDLAQENYAIYSSDGIRRTDYEFDEVIGIDSTIQFSNKDGIPEYYFGLHSVKTDKYGVYDGVNKKIVVKPIYDYVCVGWCYLSKNPHFYPGSIAYTGTTPIFHLPIGDDYHLINIHGELIFSTKALTGWQEDKRYYVNENGEAREIYGEYIQNASGNDDSPYVMKDDKGFFFVDRNGDQLLNGKRFAHIAKFNHSESKVKEANIFQIEDEHKLQSILDYSLVERIPPDYVSISFDRNNNLICKTGTNTNDFYDSNLTKLESDPRIFRREHAFLFTENGENYNRLFGIKSKDSVVIIPPKYRSIETIPNYRTRSDTIFHILTDSASSVDIFNEEFEKVMHFEADAFRFYDSFQANFRSMLILMKDAKLGLYDLEAKKWLMTDIPCVPKDSMDKWRVNGRDSHFSPRLDFYKDEVFFWFYNLDTGWNLYTDSGKHLFQWKRKTKVTPSILKMNGNSIIAKQIVGLENNDSVYICNNFGDELFLVDALSQFSCIPELDRTFVRTLGQKEYFVYDAHFNPIEELSGNLYLFDNESIYIFFDKESRSCEVVTEYGSQTIPGVNYINRRGDRLCCMRTDSSCFLASIKPSAIIREYKYGPRELTKSIYTCMSRKGRATLGQDYYHRNGKLLFEDFFLVRKASSSQRGGYIIIRNEHEELWVTSEGEIFHRNLL